MDQFSTHADALDAPARRAAAITPSDTLPLPRLTRAVYVGTGGTLVLRTAEGTEDCTFVGVPAGSVLPVRASHVRATGTTAANLVALD